MPIITTVEFTTTKGNYWISDLFTYTFNEMYIPVSLNTPNIPSCGNTLVVITYSSITNNVDESYEKCRCNFFVPNSVESFIVSGTCDTPTGYFFEE